MKVVIRKKVSEYTSLQPMTKLESIFSKILQIYSKFGHHDFYLALVTKGEIIKDYFFNYHILNSDFSIDLNNGSCKAL